MEPMDCSTPPDNPQELYVPPKRDVWTDTPEGRHAAIKVEQARMDLNETVHAGNIRLLEAERKFKDLGAQIAVIDKDLQQLSPPDPYKLLARQELLTKQAIAYNDEASDTQRELQNDLEGALRTHFRELWLRATCAQISSLPRELREMIYKAAIGAPWSFCVAEELSDDPGDFVFESRNADWVPGCHIPSDDDCFNPSVAGATVAHEMAEAWYKRSFTIFPEKGCLEEFLLHDRWGLGLRPAGLIVEIDVRISEYLLSPQNEFHSMVWSALHSLSLLKKGRKARITILAEPSYNACLNCGQYESIYNLCEMTPDLAGRATTEIKSFLADLQPIFQHLEQLNNDGFLVAFVIQEEGLYSGDILYKYGQDQGRISDFVKDEIKKNRGIIKKYTAEQCIFVGVEDGMEF